MVQVENTCFKERLFMFMFSTRDTTKRGEMQTGKQPQCPSNDGQRQALKWLQPTNEEGNVALGENLA